MYKEWLLYTCLTVVLVKSVSESCRQSIKIPPYDFDYDIVSYKVTKGDQFTFEFEESINHVGYTLLKCMYGQKIAFDNMFALHIRETICLTVDEEMNTTWTCTKTVKGNKLEEPLQFNLLVIAPNAEDIISPSVINNTNNSEGYITEQGNKDLNNSAIDEDLTIEKGKVNKWLLPIIVFVLCVLIVLIIIYVAIKYNKRNRYTKNLNNIEPTTNLNTSPISLALTTLESNYAEITSKKYDKTNYIDPYNPEKPLYSLPIPKNQRLDVNNVKYEELDFNFSKDSPRRCIIDVSDVKYEELDTYFPKDNLKRGFIEDDGYIKGVSQKNVEANKNCRTNNEYENAFDESVYNNSLEYVVPSYCEPRDLK